MAYCQSSQKKSQQKFFLLGWNSGAMIFFFRPSMSQLFPAPDTACFASVYSEARGNFLTAANRLPESVFASTQCFVHPLAGSDGKQLACDVLYVAANDTPKNVVVLMSATHGVEGFAGSAIQCDLLQRLEPELTDNPGTGFVFIHAVNPWGFDQLRRCDHEGIDINRNFIDFDRLPPVDADMQQLYEQMADWPDGLDVSNLWQLGGLAAFTEVFTRGHYLGNAAPFYGGTAPSWSRDVLERIVALPFLASATRIAVVDIHTGLGPYGYGELINDHIPGTSGFEFAQRWYGANAASAVLGESCSTLKLGLVDYLWHDAIGDRGCFVTLEFGTYPPDRLLTVLVEEQLYINHCSRTGKPPETDHASRRNLADFFKPCETSWQQMVLFRGQQVVDMAIQGMRS